MTNNMPNFRKDLARGRKGEQLLLQLWPGLISLGGKGADLQLPNGEKVELKSDYYSMQQTSNFFIEIYGNLAKSTPGGVTKALKDGCKWFVYLYVQDATAYVFDCAELQCAVQKMPQTIRYVENRNYITMGILIKRDALIHLARVLK